MLDAHINDNARLASSTKESRAKRGLNNAIKLYKMIISERLRPQAARKLCTSFSRQKSKKMTIKETSLDNDNVIPIAQKLVIPSVPKATTSHETKSLDGLDNNSSDESNESKKNSKKPETPEIILNGPNCDPSISDSSCSNVRQNLNLAYTSKALLKSSTTVFKPSHNRTRSDQTGIFNSSKRCGSIASLKSTIGDLMTGRAFDNNCNCFEQFSIRPPSPKNELRSNSNGESTETLNESDINGLFTNYMAHFFFL